MIAFMGKEFIIGIMEKSMKDFSKIVFDQDMAITNIKMEIAMKVFISTTKNMEKVLINGKMGLILKVHTLTILSNNNIILDLEKVNLLNLMVPKPPGTGTMTFCKKTGMTLLKIRGWKEMNFLS